MYKGSADALIQKHYKLIRVPPANWDHWASLRDSLQAHFASTPNGIERRRGESQGSSDAASISSTASFTTTGSMATTRMGHPATRLLDGRVLITGGFSTGIINGEFTVSFTAEIYDPGTGSFSATGRMGVARELQTATLLPNGTVLVAGGGSSTAEVYDPTSGSFSITGGMEVGRSGHSATLLPNGVLVVGGGTFIPLATTELYQLYQEGSVFDY